MDGSSFLTAEGSRVSLGRSPDDVNFLSSRYGVCGRNSISNQVGIIGRLL